MPAGHEAAIAIALGPAPQAPDLPAALAGDAVAIAVKALVVNTHHLEPARRDVGAVQIGWRIWDAGARGVGVTARARTRGRAGR